MAPRAGLRPRRWPARAALLLATLMPGIAPALPSFPGAEGFGATTPGGRGGQVVTVTSLADDGPGSLRWALEALTGPRIVVFGVGGDIVLTDEIDVNGQVTVAGQTAPEPGVTIRGARLHVVGDDVIVRGLRLRPGVGPGQELENRDGISVGARDRVVRRVVIDRNSVTWATDENMATWYRVEDVTFSNNLVAEALNEAGHPDGRHSMGMLIGDDARRVSILRNLFVSNRWRNPQIKEPEDVEVINNYVFNFGPDGLSVPNGPARLDVINNVYEAGPDTPQPDARAAIQLTPGAAGDLYHVSGNATPMGPDAVRGDGAARLIPRRVVVGGAATALPTPLVKAFVLATAGARAPFLDATDRRIVAGAASGHGAIVDAPPDGPVGTVPIVARDSDRRDRDGDGLPDAREAEFGGDPAIADSHLIDPTSGYALIELYANSLFPR